MQDRSLKIYKPQDLEGLLNIDKLKLKTQQECDKLLEFTKNKCQTLEKETYDAAMQKFHKEQLELFEKTHKKVSDFFEASKYELNGILKVVFDKLKLEQSVCKVLTGLLFTEVEKLKIKSNKFTIYANSQILYTLQANIKEEYIAKEGVYFDYDIKNELSSDECLVESDYVMARINVNDFYEKALKVINTFVQE